MKTNWFKRTLCGILAFIMVLAYVPATAFAAAEDGLCEHHTQHTQECGCSPAVEAHDCGHEHTDDCYDTVTECVHTHDDCGFVEVVAGVSCGHICSEESGCIQRVMNCQHQHDSECGYAEEKTESSCTYACEECEKERAPQQNKRSEEQALDISSILTWEDYLYTLLADGSVSICGFEGAPENEEETFLVEIPSEINGAKVTEIAEKAFAGNEEIEIALLPKTIDAIGNGAFEDCKNLKVVAFCGEDLSFGKSFAKYSEKLETILVLKDSDFAELANILEQDLGEAKAGSIQFRSFTNIAALEEAVQAEGANSGNGDVDRQLGNEISALNTAGNINALTTTYGKATMEASENENIVASGLCGENVQWKLDKDGLLTISGTGEMQDYDSHDAPWHDEQFEIKSVIVEKNVTNIGVAAFWDCGSITSVTISEGVNSIGEDAFRACSNLTSVTIPEGVTSIGNCAFGDCINLISVSIPESVTTIGNGVFYRCNSLTSVTIPEGITAIASETFYGCSSLTSLTIPKSVTSIGAYAFEGCSGLTSMAIPEGVAAIGVGAFRYCSGLATVSIPKGVATLDNYTFDGCSSLVSATIPEGVATIGGAAFSNCSNLTSATIPSSVTSIGFAAFSGCTKLTDIHYSGTAENWEKIAIGDDNTALINAEIQFNATLDKTIASGKCGANVFWTLDSEGILTISGLGQMNNFATSYPEWGDRKSIIKQVKITEGVESIGARAFEDYYNIESVIIPASVSQIGWNAFYRCSRLTSATIAEGVTSIGSKAFGECRSLSSFSIPSSVNQIGSWAFCKCESITSIIVPDGVTTIGEYTFDSCTSLTSVTIPDSITVIDDAAFNCCNNLKRVNITDIGKWCQIKFYDTDSNPLLYAGNLYLNGNLLTEVDIPEGTPKISDHSFCYCNSLIKVTIPRSVTSIGEEAFSGCENLMSVTIPSGVTHIGRSAFSSCSSLTGISIPDSVSSIGDEAFYGCSSLETVSLSGRITEIGKGLFSRCRSLSSVEIPDGVTSIGDRAFSYCSGLTSITIPASITSIGNAAFDSCNKLASIYISDIAKWCAISFGSGSHYTNTNPLRYGGDLYLNGQLLTDVIIPSGVTRIKDDAFGGCGSITRVVIPNGATHIGARAFSYCEKLESIVIPQSLTYVGDSAFTACTSLSGVYITDLSSWCNITFYSASSNPLSCAGNLYLNGVLMTEIDIPKGTSKISSYAFYSSNLTKVTIPDSVAQIGKEAFCACVELTSITIPGSVAKIEYGAFEGCHNLTNATIKKGVETIGEYAFYNCIRLKNVTMSSSVTMIDHAAFYCCGSLTDVYYTGSEEQWGKINIWWSGNDDLTDATIHYNSAEPISGNVYYFSAWDAANQTAYFGPGDMLGSQVTEETDADFVANPTAFLRQYVLLETKPRTDGDVGPDILISVKAVESKTGTVTAADATSVTIDSKTYATPASITQPESYVDQFVLYHLYNGSLVEVEILETIEGTLISWDEQTRVLNVNLDGAAKNPVVYTLSPLADEKTVSQLSSGLLLNSKVKCLTDCNCVVFYVESTESSFSKAIYHADSLIEDEVVNLNSFIRQINQYSPAVIVLNRSDVDDWAEAWDELTTFYDTLASGDAYLKRKFKQTDIYEAILLTALECSTSDDSAYAWGLATVKKEVSFTKSVLSWVKDYVELEYNWKLATNMEISSMTKGQKEELKSALQKALEEFGVMDLVDDMTESADILGDILAVASTAEDLVEKVSVYMELWYVSDSMAAVLDEMLLKIPNTDEYTPMRSAVTFCRDMIEETNRDQFKKGALLRADFMVGEKFILSEGVSFIWGKIKEKVVAQNPELNILLIAYKASHSLTNFFFNTDNISEQIYKLKAVERYMSYLENAIHSIEKQYTENKTEENANKLLNAISLLNAFAVEECDIACDFASAVEKVSVGGGNGTDTTLKEYATGTREFYIGLNVEAATHWVYHLCDDYPEKYPDYAELIDGNGGASKEVLEKSLVVRITSDYIIECPVNVRAYNNNGTLAANLCGDGTYVLGNLSAVQLGDRKFITIGNSGVYRIECDGYADGMMTVTIREYQGVEKIREAVFYDMEVTSDTVYDLNTKTNPLDNTIHTISLGENSIPADYDSGIEKCIEHTYNTPRFNWHADYSCDAVFICMCGDDKQIQKCTVTSATTPPTATEAGKTVYTATIEFDGQTYTDIVSIADSGEARINVDGIGLTASDEVWIDGVEYSVQSDGNGLYVALPDANAHTMVTYSYNNPNATDVHTKYPTGMNVWTLAQENGVYSATYVSELDNLLQYSGSSIRITGNKGIRMITSINQDTRNKLTGNGLAGFKLLEYGTLLAQTSKLKDNPLVLGGGDYVKSNYAYKKGVADPVFKYANGLIQYTNVLVGFTDDQCAEDIAMRPYMKLLDENGEEFAIYGGIVYRSIGYIAYQNRNAFQPGSAAYEYVWSIIHNVYGNQYDSEYKK